MTGTYVTDLVTADAQCVTQDGVGLTDQLHVTVLDTVVYHLDEMTGTFRPDPITTRLLVALGADRLEDWLQVRPV